MQCIGIPHIMITDKAKQKCCGTDIIVSILMAVLFTSMETRHVCAGWIQKTGCIGYDVLS